MFIGYLPLAHILAVAAELCPSAAPRVSLTRAFSLQVLLFDGQLRGLCRCQVPACRRRFGTRRSGRLRLEASPVRNSETLRSREVLPAGWPAGAESRELTQNPRAERPRRICGAPRFKPTLMAGVPKAVSSPSGTIRDCLAAWQVWETIKKGGYPNWGFGAFVSMQCSSLQVCKPIKCGCDTRLPTGPQDSKVRR